jgi:hypothetical protein
MRLDGALDLAGLQAAGADVHALGGAVHDGADALHVGVPPLRRAAVRMGDLHAEERLLPTDVADGGHGPSRVTDAQGPQLVHLAPEAMGGQSERSDGGEVGMQGDEGKKKDYYGFESSIPPGKTIQDVKEEMARQQGVRFVAQFMGKFILFAAAQHDTLEEAQAAIGDYVNAGFRTDWTKLVQQGRVMAPKRGSPPYCAMIRAQATGNTDAKTVLSAIDDVFEERAHADPRHVHFSYGSGIIEGGIYNLLVDLGHDTEDGLHDLIEEVRSVPGVEQDSFDPGTAYLPGNAIRPGKPEAS